MTAFRPRALFLLLLSGVFLMLGGTHTVCAAEYRLPDAAEISSYSPEALEFYSSGIASLDRADEINACSQLVKAAQLQPNARRLNHIAGALALRRARSTAGTEARNYYETALVLYEALKAQGNLDEDFRRDVENRIKVIKDERDNLDQRDTKRDALGVMFIQDLNRAYTQADKAKKAREAAAKATPTPALPVGAPIPQASVPLQPAGVPPAGYGQPVQPGVGVQPYPEAVPTPASYNPSMPIGPGNMPLPPSRGGNADPMMQPPAGYMAK